ncbi:MAG: CxxxxCH/CxxCH domain-containing protein [Bacteroidota bacterium]
MELSRKDRVCGKWGGTRYLISLFSILLLSVSSSFAQTSETFTSSTSWPAPAGVTSVQVECWGAGGAGGGNSTSADGGGGGGGGAYSRTANISVIPGNSYTITVGVGGVGVSGGTGGDGGDTWFIDASTIFAQAGTGGGPPVGGAAGVGGTGGAAGSGIGDTRFSGGSGGAGRDHNQGQGGPGGSSAGTAADGWSGLATWNTSIASAGPAGSGIGGNGGPLNQNGSPGTIPGGAGGGSGEGTVSGGNGANGQVILTYTALSDNCPESTSVSPSGIQTLCQGDASNLLTATITLSGGSGTPTLQYQWYYNTTNSNTVVGATLVAGATSDTYTPLTTASEVGSRWYFCVGYATDNGCGQTNADQSLASNAVEVTVEPPQPVTPGAITGTTPVPPSTGGLVYSISVVPNATTYTWTVPTGWSITGGQGTISITATSGTVGQDGDITVTAGNSCGTSAASTLAVTVEDVPVSDCPQSTSVAPPGIQTHCVDDPASQLTATISTSGGSGTPTLLYQWYYNTSNSNTVSGATLVAGATTDTYTPLTTASELGSRWYFCVGYATNNGCLQTNADQSLASNAVEVTVNDVPATPGLITGSDNVNPSTSGLVYSISAIPTAASYTWTVPTGWAITGGQGTTSMTATSGTVGQDGNITVTATNACGTSAPSTKAVTVTEAALPPTITLGTNPTVCQGTTTADLTYSATTESPDQYSIDYFAASEAEGFTDVVNASLPASPITLVVPGGAATGRYYGNLTVRNSGTGLSSGNYAISVTIATTPATPGLIFGSTAVPESTTGISYAIIAVQDATTYTWSVPTGWVITEGEGTTSIVVTSGSAGQNGDITVTAGNSCGTSAAATLAVTSETPVDHILYGCNACHITHSSLGGTLTNTLGNSNLCMSCHVTSGAAGGKPFTEADKAIPGTSGNSHSWDVASVNATYETVLTTDPDMVLRVDEGNITCSTCHNQHNSNTNLSYTRISNAGDFMCKDCHSPRDVGRYMDNTTDHKGSHPVGLAYSGTGDYEPTPTGSAILVGGNIECSSCHQTHYAPTSDGTLLRQANDDALCTSCHTLGTHNGMGCNDCHQPHNTNKSNIYMIRNSITTPSSGDKTVVFTALTGTNSFADGDATYDGICEVCHTSTLHYRNDGSGGDQDHTSSGGPMDGLDCKGCHPHNSNFSPAGGSCDDCHNTTAPTFGSAVHIKHKDTYGYACSTCHFQYGSGGSLEGTHPSGTIDVNFDPGGMATRNGLDAITPVMNGDNTCDNMYCHSDGRSAYRGMDDTYTWSGTTGSQPGTYATTPAWGTGTITTCMPCHSGTGEMIDPYEIYTPGLADPLPPATGSHRRGAHVSNSQELSGNGWDVVNCFFCHNTAGGDDGSPILQGTYGTSFHVDGATYFDPRSFVDGGTLANSNTGGSYSYSLLGSAGHCGDGKTCW